ncbi:MAG: nucleotidyltransferase domain-containing protein, partial [Candidatus Bathyarchaeia archaeon]
MMLKDEIVRRVIRVLERDENVLLAYLFGSTARGTAQPISDIDIAVLLKDNSFEKQADILWRIAKASHMSEDRIDLVDLSRADLHLKYNILREGIKLIDKGSEEQLTRELIEYYPEIRENLNIVLRAWLKEDPCIDQAIVSRRLD